MRTLIIGGAACGKSAYAEALALQMPGPHYYLATMQPLGADAAARIARHRQLRAGKGFQTLECYRDLAALRLPERGTLLLECLGNLTANELFAPGADPQRAAQAIVAGLSALERQTAHLLVVSNDVFGDGLTYAEETQLYLQLLGNLNQQLAERYEQVVELVCGLAIRQKGKPLCAS